MNRLRHLLGWAMLAAVAGAGAAPPPPLQAGRPVEGTLAAGQARTYSLALAAGDFVRGRLDGPRMRLVLLDGQGKRLRALVDGRGESQTFMFVAGDTPSGALEVRAPDGGRYALCLDEIVPRAAQVAPAGVLDSPRLRALQHVLDSGGDSEAFWREVVRDGAPLVETADVMPALEDGQALVTFLWRGARESVRLFGAPSGDHDELQRLGNSDVWFRSYRVPRSTRLGYKLAPDVPELNAPSATRRQAILATAQRDPLNPRAFPASPPDRYAGESVLELAEAPPQDWVEPRAGVQAGQIESHRVHSRLLDNTRDVYLYRPYGYRPGADGNALLVLFDADAYLHEVPTPTVLDNLVAAGAIPPTAAILIGNPDRRRRAAELPPNPVFARFLAEELMPWARRQGIQAVAGRTVIAGSSFGGLAAAYAGLRHPEWFGKVYSQSGSFWWQPGPERAGADGEPEWLTRQFAAAPRLPLTFYLEAGQFEGGKSQTGIFESTRHLRDVLRARGYQVMHREYASGHDYLHWRGTLATGLTALLGEPPSAR